MVSVQTLTREHGEAVDGYSYGFLDAVSKREIRRSLLKAVAIPGYQVPFGSRELPIARGWGTGGLQITLSILGPEDVIKVIDQGDDASVNASNLRRLVERTAGLPTTIETAEATIVQTRHRIPEERLRADQTLVLQVPAPEPLRRVERSMAVARRMHAESDYSRMWLAIYEDIVRRGELGGGAGYPVFVNDRFIMAPSPIPRWDVPKLHMAEALFLFGAGREKRLYAVPPFTKVVPLEFEDYRFEVESFDGLRCARCGSTMSFLDEAVQADGSRLYLCSDTAYCERALHGEEVTRW
ncbi:MAG: alpha-D-ribose 1-methylphosphonate 5-phosphate C-P-lyase PhnJ [Dehalococcoidia bacterium]